MRFGTALSAILCAALNLVVQDATGAVVANAQVTITQLATTEARRTVTNERGEFSLPYVRIGSYAVSAEAAGFKRKTLTGIELQVDQTANLRIELEVGASQAGAIDRQIGAGRPAQRSAVHQIGKRLT